MIEDTNKIYKELRKKYTDEEISESCIFPIDITDEEKKELVKIFKSRRKLTPEERKCIAKFTDNDPCKNR